MSVCPLTSARNTHRDARIMLLMRSWHRIRSSALLHNHTWGSCLCACDDARAVKRWPGADDPADDPGCCTLPATATTTSTSAAATPMAERLMKLLAVGAGSSSVYHSWVSGGRTTWHVCMCACVHVHGHARETIDAC
jgi:hypothetical protein